MRGGGYAWQFVRASSDPSVPRYGAGVPAPGGAFSQSDQRYLECVMLRVRWNWKTAVAALAFAAAIASMAEGSPAGRFRPFKESATSEASGLVVKAHGSHIACRYGKYGKSKEGWHRHDGGVYRCAPASTEAPQRFGPSSTGKGSRPGSSGQRTTPPSSGQKPGTTPPSSGQKTSPTPIPKRR